MIATTDNELRITDVGEAIIVKVKGEIVGVVYYKSAAVRLVERHSPGALPDEVEFVATRIYSLL